MILSCDPSRHAFLIHFGKRQRPAAFEVLHAEYRDARVEIAVDTASSPPSLVAIHFVRHGFRLPFVGRPNEFSTDSFHLQSGRLQNRYFFHFSFEPKDCLEWQVVSGLRLLITEPAGQARDQPSGLELRPVLHGLVVDLDVINVEVDASEFVFELGPDNLKDVPVTLFMDRTGA
jgi:hypothetical protein